MRGVNLFIILSSTALTACVGGDAWTQTQDKRPSVDIWKAAAAGDLETIEHHIAAGTDLNLKILRAEILP